MAFEPGQKVRHKASGEVGVIIRNTASDAYDISTGFDQECNVLESLLEPVDEPTPGAIPTSDAITESGQTLDVTIDGERRTVRALSKQGLGLICQSKTGMHYVRVEHADDPGEFRKVLESL